MPLDPAATHSADRSSASPIARSAGAAGIATLASRILGLVRDQVLAALFGAGNTMDAFIVAFRIPNLVRDLFAEGAMSAAFVPTFTRHLGHQGRAAAWRLGNNVLTVLFLLTGTVVAIGILFAGPLVTFYAGDYAQVPGKLELTIRLTRVMLPFLTLAALAAAMMGMLNSLRHYFIPALAPAMFNIATILCAFALVPLMPYWSMPGIMAIAFAAVLGGLGQIALQWPALRREGFRYRPMLDARDPGLREVLALMGPGTLGLAATQVNLLVNTLIATGEGTGAVSWLTYAFRILYLPIGLVGVSIATAVLPAVSRQAAAGDPGAIRATLSRGLALMIVLNVPATLGLLALATPIVRLLFERGRFLPADTAATAAALQLYALGLVGYSAARIASPIFYALGEHRVAVGASVGAIGVNLVASTLLVRVLGFRGLALGATLAALTHAVALLVLLRPRLRGVGGRRLGVTFAKASAAAIVMALVAVTTERWTAAIAPGDGAVVQAIRLGLAIGAGLAALTASAAVLRIREFQEAADFARAQVRKWLDGSTGAVS